MDGRTSGAQRSGCVAIGAEGQDIVVNDVKCRPTDRVEIIGKDILIRQGAVKCERLVICASGSVMWLPNLKCVGRLTTTCFNGRVIYGTTIMYPQQPALWQVGEAVITAEGSRIFMGIIASRQCIVLLRSLGVSDDRITEMIRAIPSNQAQLDVGGNPRIPEKLQPLVAAAQEAGAHKVEGNVDSLPED